MAPPARVLFPWLALALGLAACHAPAPPQAPPPPPPASAAAPAATAPAPLSTADRDALFHHVRPHWLADATHFVYREQLAAGARAYFLVDAATGQRTPAFDHARLAASLSRASGKDFRPDRLRLVHLEVDEKDHALVFSAADHRWRCDLATYAIVPERDPPGGAGKAGLTATTHTGPAADVVFVNRTHGPVAVYWLDFEGHRQLYATLDPGERHKQSTYEGHVWVLTDDAHHVLTTFQTHEEGGNVEVDDDDRPDNDKPDAPDKPAAPPPPAADKPAAKDGAGARRGPPRASSPTSPTSPRATRPTREPGVAAPDGHREAFVREHNVYLRDSRTHAEVALSHDGTTDDSYATEELHWSPDSSRLVAMRTRKGDERKVYLIESSPHDQLQPRRSSYDYLKPGDRIPVSKPHLFDVATRAPIPVSDALFAEPWSITELRWSADSRRFTFLFNQRGHQALRVVAVDAHTGEARAIVDETSKTFIDYSDKLYYRPLDRTHELLWMSERDGYNHLYLYDADTGAVKAQVTRGEWAVRSVEWVDEKNRQVWLFAGGVRPGQDPYYLHLCRVGFDGTGFTVLTEGDGMHVVDFSPDRRFFIDTWSRVDMPGVSELRRSSDGKLLRELERADDHALLASGWSVPERFVAKGRDGKTDIYGILIRPSHFDPSRRYPVIEQIYASPTGAYVPKTFALEEAQHKLADHGFVVVQIDGMGTSFRSKAFQDVAWKNLADSGFPDRIAWMRAAAAKHPEMDLTRVGIYGGSAGGQSAMRALLSYGDFYKAAVADSGCHDNRMDKIWWNEQFMGWPVDESYARSSNVVDAHKLSGKLLLIVGELDHNVDPSSTMQVVDALVRADKDFELLVVPGGGHGVGDSPYGKRRTTEFFERNLLGHAP